MKIYQLLDALFSKFVPMSEHDKLELQSGAMDWYNKQLDKAVIREQKNKEIIEENEAFMDDADYKPKPTLKPTLSENIFKHLDAWYSRYLFAAAFIFLVPLIKSFINGEFFGSEDSEPESDFSLDDYMEFKRLQKRG